MTSLKGFLGGPLLLEGRGSATVIDRDDLIFIQSALSKYEEKDTHECFVSALVEALRIVSDGRVKLSSRDLSRMLKANEKEGEERLHYANVVAALGRYPVRSRSGLKGHLVELDVELPTTRAAVKAELRAGHPVIISVNINDAYWDFFGHISGWREPNHWELKKYGTLPAPFLAKLKAGIIPYPTPEIIKAATTHTSNHAITCVGYDASEGTFICKDVLVTAGQVKLSGLFKMEEKIFFDEKLGKLVIVLHAMSISIAKETEVDLAELARGEASDKLKAYVKYELKRDLTWIRLLYRVSGLSVELARSRLTKDPETAGELAELTLLVLEGEGESRVIIDLAKLIEKVLGKQPNQAERQAASIYDDSFSWSSTSSRLKQLKGTLGPDLWKEQRTELKAHVLKQVKLELGEGERW